MLPRYNLAEVTANDNQTQYFKLLSKPTLNESVMVVKRLLLKCKLNKVCEVGTENLDNPKIEIGEINNSSSLIILVAMIRYCICMKLKKSCNSSYRGIR